MVTSPVALMTQLAPEGTPPSSPSCLRAARRAESQFSASTEASRVPVVPLMGVTTNFQVLPAKLLRWPRPVCASDETGGRADLVLVIAATAGQANDPET